MLFRSKASSHTPYKIPHTTQYNTILSIFQFLATSSFQIICHCLLPHRPKFSKPQITPCLSKFPSFLPINQTSTTECLCICRSVVCHASLLNFHSFPSFFFLISILFMLFHPSRSQITSNHSLKIV